MKNAIEKPGSYAARVVESYLKTAKTGTVQIAILFETDEGERITAYRPLTPPAWDSFVKDDLLILGWDASKRNYSFEELDTENSPLIGAECQIVVVEKEGYDGRDPYLAVQFINDPEGGRKRLTEEERKGVADQLRRDLGMGAPSDTKGEDSDFAEIPF